ncbi:MAG TPA: hypothetical protein VF189_01180 [Patescibacteria group bacterium]
MENRQRPQLPNLPNTFDIRLRLENPPEKRQIPGAFFGMIMMGVVEPRPFFPSKEEASKYLEDRITQRRKDFIKEYKEGMHGGYVLTYEPALDREVYKELRRHKDIHPQAYQDSLQGLRYYTKDQVHTFIGERLNVGLSKFSYDLKFGESGKGVMHGQGMEEPLIQMIERGRDCRDELVESIDLPRQTAEITQFEKIQEVLGNPEAEIGTTVVSFSPPGREGSAYGHNFYDVFILKEKDIPSNLGEVKKEKYIEARRYASGLSIRESLEKAEELNPGFKSEFKKEEENLDAFLISRPVVLRPESKFFNDPEKIHQDLQKGEKAMSYEKFQRDIIQDETFSQMVDFYIQTLEETPEDKRILDTTLNAIMNRADELAGLSALTLPTQRRDYPDRGPVMPLPILSQINQYAARDVRETSTGCGLSGSVGGEDSSSAGYGANRLPSNMSKKKSTDVASGEDKYGSRTFECPECHETNYRPYNELLPSCQYCGTTKVAC